MNIKTLLACLIIVISCSDEPTVTPSNTQSALAGVLAFKNIESFQNFIDENSNGRIATDNFESFEAVFQKALTELEGAPDKETWKKIMQSYSDIVFEQDSIIKPIIPISPYMRICNRERIYKTATIANKVFDRYVVSTAESNLELLKQINGIDELDTTVFTVHNYIIESLESENGRVKTTCGRSHNAGYYYNPSGCIDDRKLDVAALAITLDFIRDVNGLKQTVYVPAVSIVASGSRRMGTFCNWKSYQTIFYFKNVSFTLNTFSNINRTDFGTTSLTIPVGMTVQDATSPSEVATYYLMSSYRIGDNIINEPLSKFDFGFTKIHIEAASRGTHGGWAIIDCGN